jgi:hypothetical protein
LVYTGKGNGYEAGELFFRLLLLRFNTDNSIVRQAEMHNQYARLRRDYVASKWRYAEDDSRQPGLVLPARAWIVVDAPVEFLKAKGART